HHCHEPLQRSQRPRPPGEAALALGADRVIDYRTTSVADYVEALTGGQGFDVVFDTVGMGNLDGSFQAARAGGTVVTCVARSTHDLSPLHAKGLSLHVVFMLLPLLTGRGRERHGEILRRVSELVDAGKLRPLIHERRYSFDEVPAAHAALEAGEAFGKILIRIG
ncbi:MAG: zinc-binding dehydrogenase, partial [Magnetococcales bacterium]|nr:zinc-binding dehydrogenase [Magnetococcales bacterium]